MILVSLLLMGIAIATLILSRNITDEVLRSASSLHALLCLLLSLILSPWLVKLVLLAGLFSLPTCLWDSHLGSRTCAKTCAVRVPCAYLNPHPPHV